MAQQEYLARDFFFQVNTGTVGTPVWTEIGGITTWDVKEAGKDADATDFSDNGYSSAMIVSATVSITLKGNLNTDGATRDPGQAKCEALARTFGPDGIGQFRIWGPRTASDFASADASIAFDAAVKLAGTGGGNDALLSWSAELLVDGAPTYDGFFA